MAFDGNKPAVTEGKVSILSSIRDNLTRLAQCYGNGTGDSNIPTGAIRIDPADGQVYQWTGSWVSLGYISLARDPVSDIVDGAPVALDTLNELAAALGDSPLLDEDDMASNSATKGVTQQSLVAYVDAMAVASLTEDYGVYTETLNDGATTANLVSGLLGTRIDITDPNYSASSFNLILDSRMYDNVTDGLTSLIIHGVIKKKSGSEPYVIATATYFAVGRSWTVRGTLGTGATSQTVTAHSTTFTIDRVESASELCFRITLDGSAGGIAADYHKITSYLTGPKNYTGTAITSSNGTLF